MAEKNKSPMMNIPMVMALILLCLTLISTHFTAGLYARYVSRAAGSDSARVAKFNITESVFYDGNSHQLNSSFSVGITPDDTAVIVFTVNNQSEVTVKCSILVENVYRNIPFEMKMNGVNSVNGLLEVNNIYLSSNASEDFSLDIVWSKEGALEYIKKTDLVRITLIVEQVD